MELLKKLENKIMEINESLPSLPQGLVDFLAEWAWLFTAVTAALGVFAIFTIFSIGLIGSLALLGIGAGLAILALLSTIVFGLLGNIITIYLNILAVKPLRAKLYRGWQLMLLAGALGFVFGLIENLVDGNFSSMVSSVLVYAISLYFMAQVRDRFVLGEEIRDLKDLRKAQVE